MALHKRFRDAVSLVVMEHPFFASILLQMEYKEAPETIKTMATDGRRIYVNNDFVESLTLQHTAAVVVHEVCHVIFQHHFRLAEVTNAMGATEREWAQLWNVATDYAINLQLRDEEHMSLPEPHLYDAAYAGMTAEEILDRLIQDGVTVPLPGGNMGVVLAAAGEDGEVLDDEGITKARIDLSNQIVQGAMAARQMGKMPGFAETLVKKLTDVKADWREILWSHVSSGKSFGFDWNRPNRRFWNTPFVLPSFGAQGVSALNCIIDTSGSVSDHALRRFLTELNAAVEVYGIEDVIIVQVDTRVTDIRRATVAEGDIQLGVKGRGGTDMNPGFDVLRDERPAPTILFSDMQIPPLRPFPHPTIFCCYGPGGYVPDWGTFVDVTG